MPGLDELRALAVLGVIAYHLQLGFAPGGLLGVDVFFVLSGYLITDLLVAEWQENGRRYSRPASSSSEVARQAGYDLLLMMQWVAQEIQGS
jgi:peptidoglycan/LPS O-acetylase OafA/YrhL